MPRNEQSRRWCFTINNFGPSDVIRLRNLGRNIGSGFLVFGREGRRPGHTPHLQGYVEFPRKKRFGAIKRLLGGRAHIERARGKPNQAADYCRKEGDSEEFGKLKSSQQGRRTDLELCKQILDDGGRVADLAQDHFSLWLFHRRGFAEYVQLKRRSRDFKSMVTVLHGDTGTGKTRWVFENEPNLWISGDNGFSWFDGYDGHEAALFDDFTGVAPSKFGFLLKLLDRYPMKVPIKGGFVEWIPKRIYFTSNLPVEEWYTGVTDVQISALMRRIDHVKHFTSLGME